MLRISREQDEEFRYRQVWLSATAAVDRLVELTAADSDGRLWPMDSATDNALSRLTGSLSSRDLTAQANTPHPLFERTVRGGSPMWIDMYVAEKVSELERERLARIRHAELRKLMSQRPTLFGRLAAVSGRWLRRLGETLELWAAPSSERETVRVAFERARRLR